MTSKCYNQASLNIALNLVFHAKTKHIEIDCRFLKEKITSSDIAKSSVKSNDQLTDVLQNLCEVLEKSYICGKFGTFDLYTPT